MIDLKGYSLELGFDDFGVADATLGTPGSQAYLDSLSEGRHGPLDYMARTIDERSDVQKLMPGSKSVVVVVKNYYTGDHADFVSLDDLKRKAKVSRYAWGQDYHHWFRKRLRKMRAAMLEHNPSARVHIFNDTGPVLERSWAVQAGLGFVGKSNMFIHRRFGTWVFLGGFVTDIELSPNRVIMKSLCGTCRRCLDACPTSALVAPYKLDARRCLTTWNVERPFEPSADHPDLMGHRWAVGCDICQEVCPWNKFEAETSEPRFQPIEGRIALSEAPIGNLNGTPLARPKKEGIEKSLQRALSSI
jgi:epoxyqueuosine reductase